LPTYPAARASASAVRARAFMRPDVHAVARPHHVLADVARGARLSQRRVHAALLHGEFAAHIDVRVMRADRAARDEDPLDDGVRIVFELVAIGEGARLALVAVDTNVNRLLRFLRDEAPFDAGWKRRAAASAKIRVLDLVDNVFGRHVECLAQRFVSAVGEVHVELFKVRDVQPAS